ncbi:MAG: SAM-dependent methyltransferase [Verrucomicrobiales bacterium]|jgi:SAM-dependent methyltransferase
MALKQAIKTTPVIGKAIRSVYLGIRRRRFNSSNDYWKSSYVNGGHSISGTYSKFTRFKAEVLNKFVRDRGLASVAEFGCGDGNQLRLAEYPSYVGFDISGSALQICRDTFADDLTKAFRLVCEGITYPADLVLSLDVIYHLVEDEAFEAHMTVLFENSKRYVGIYSSNNDEQEELQPPHVRHRKFSTWIAKHAPDYQLIDHIPNPLPYDGHADETSFADFFFYEKKSV